MGGQVLADAMSRSNNLFKYPEATSLTAYTLTLQAGADGKVTGTWSSPAGKGALTGVVQPLPAAVNIFTQDRDFLVLAARWQQSRHEFAGMIYGQQLRVTVGGAVCDIALIASVMTQAGMWNRVEFLPL